MDEPTDDVELVGGLANGHRVPVAAGWTRFYIPTRMIGRDPETGGPIFGNALYADTGRRTADGRRVFAVEGGV